MRGRGLCPEAQCPGGVRGFSFRGRDPARSILNRDQTKNFNQTSVRERKRLHGFDTGEKFSPVLRFQGLKISGVVSAQAAIHDFLLRLGQRP